MTLEQKTSDERIGRRFIRLCAEPRSPGEVSTTIDDLVAGDHIAYGTSRGTLLGRRALNDHIRATRRAFPSLSYHVDNVSGGADVVYCQWSVRDIEGSGRRERSVPDWKTMAVRITDDRVTETWQPCDPWVALWSDLTVVPPNRSSPRVDRPSLEQAVGARTADTSWAHD